MIAQTPFQELPLLPGEYEFLSTMNWLEQFGDHDHKVVEFQIDGYTLKVESIVSRKPNCACEHDTRPTICRLYPLLPVFEVDGRLVGTESIGIYEEMERIAEMESACKLTSLPFDQANKFLAITSEIARDPKRLFYLEAYRLTKHHVAARLADRYRDGEKQRDIFSLFESAFIRRKLIDTTQLSIELNGLAARYEQYFGERFQKAMAENVTG